MARGRAGAAAVKGRARGKPIELTDDEQEALAAAEAELEGAGDDEPEPDEPEEDQDPLDKIKRKIAERSAKQIAMAVSREMPGEDPTTLLSLKITPEQFDEYEDVIVKKYGGTDPDGRYRVIFRAGGTYAGTTTFRAAGAPLDVTHETAEPEQEPAVMAPGNGAAHAPPLTLEAATALMSKLLDDQRTRDKLARLEALEAENAELKRNPPKGEAGPSAVTELTTAWKDLTAQAFKKADTESPEVAQLRTTLDAQTKALADMKEKMAEREQKLATERFDEIKREIRLMRKKKLKKSPLGSMTGTLLEITAADAMLAKLTKRVDDGESGGLLDSMLDVFKPEMAKLGSSMFKTFRRQMEASQRERPADGQPGEINPKAWAAWVGAIMDKPLLVQDREHVRAGLKHFGPHVKRMIGVNDKVQLVAFIRETLNQKTAEGFEAAKDEEIAGVLGMLDELRATVVSLATEPDQDAPETETDEDDDEDTVGGKVSE